MELRDLFVATVALVLGCMMLTTSILNDGWFFQMKIARAIAASKGRAQARTFLGSVGALMVLLGLYLIVAPYAMTFFQANENRSGNRSLNTDPTKLAESNS